MNITLVTVYFAPEISPITHLYADLAADLTRYGAVVTVVCSMPNRGLDEKTRAMYRTRTRERAPEGYDILRVGGGAESGGLIGRGLHLLKSTAALYRAAKAVPTDAYLLGSMPPFLGLVGAWLRKCAPTVYILQDIFPDTLLKMGRFSPGHPLIRACRWMERKSYAGNTRFVTISQDMADTLVGRGVARERVTVIPNWIDSTAVTPIDRASNPLFDTFAIPRERFIALYAGTVNVLQAPDTLLDAAKLLSSRAPELLLVLFGGGGMMEHVKKRVGQERIENVLLLPLQEQRLVSAVYSVGDVALIPLGRGVTDVAMPSKTWTAMAAGRPIVVTADPNSDLARVITEADCGYVVEPEDAKALADALARAYRERETLPARGARARAYVQQELGREKATRAYYDCLQRAMDAPIGK